MLMLYYFLIYWFILWQLRTRMYLFGLFPLLPSLTPPPNPLLSSLPYFHAALFVADGVDVTGFLESLAWAWVCCWSVEHRQFFNQWLLHWRHGLSYSRRWFLRLWGTQKGAHESLCLSALGCQRAPTCKALVLAGTAALTSWLQWPWPVQKTAFDNGSHHPSALSSYFPLFYHVSWALQGGSYTAVLLGSEHATVTPGTLTNY